MLCNAEKEFCQIESKVKLLPRRFNVKMTFVTIYHNDYCNNKKGSKYQLCGVKQRIFAKTTEPNVWRFTYPRTLTSVTNALFLDLHVAFGSLSATPMHIMYMDSPYLTWLGFHEVTMALEHCTK